MPGIEPGSEKFDREYTTSIVALLLSSVGALSDRLPYRPADPLGLAVSASREPHPSLYDARNSRHRGSREADVTPVRASGFS